MSMGTPSPERLRLPPSGRWDDAVFSPVSQRLDGWMSPRAELFLMRGKCGLSHHLATLGAFTGAVK